MIRLGRRLLLVFLLSVGAAGIWPAAAQTVDSTPRIAVISAFPAEWHLLLSKATIDRTEQVNGVQFALGKLADKNVVLFLSGVSMVNAAMNAQLALDRFKITHIVFSGIAGGVNPSLNIGDVVIPSRWAQYQEMVYARETGDGYAPPPHMKDLKPNFGFMFPRDVDVRSAAKPTGEEKFWFNVDSTMLATARAALLGTKLRECAAHSSCLKEQPKVVIGGNGVSGQTFVDNAKFRKWAYDTFRADVLDMETAAVSQVAYANGVPFIAFRSLSDLAGGGPGQNEISTFFQVAADNAATALIAFLKAWK